MKLNSFQRAKCWTAVLLCCKNNLQNVCIKLTLLRCLFQNAPVRSALPTLSSATVISEHPPRAIGYSGGSRARWPVKNVVRDRPRLVKIFLYIFKHFHSVEVGNKWSYISNPPFHGAHMNFTIHATWFINLTFLNLLTVITCDGYTYCKVPHHVIFSTCFMTTISLAFRKKNMSNKEKLLQSSFSFVSKLVS